MTKYVFKILKSLVFLNQMPRLVKYTVQSNLIGMMGKILQYPSNFKIFFIANRRNSWIKNQFAGFDT